MVQVEEEANEEKEKEKITHKKEVFNLFFLGIIIYIIYYNMEYMNEGELILAYTYDDIYIDLLKFIRHDDRSNFTKTIDYLLTLDPNVFINYPMFNKLIIYTFTYSDDIDMYYFINYLLDNGLNLNNTFPYSSQANTNFPNITIFNKVIYRMCNDLNHMLDTNISYDGWK